MTIPKDRSNSRYAKNPKLTLFKECKNYDIYCLKSQYSQFIEYVKNLKLSVHNHSEFYRYCQPSMIKIPCYIDQRLCDDNNEFYSHILNKYYDIKLAKYQGFHDSSRKEMKTELSKNAMKRKYESERLTMINETLISFTKNVISSSKQPWPYLEKEFDGTSVTIVINESKKSDNIETFTKLLKSKITTKLNEADDELHKFHSGAVNMLLGCQIFIITQELSNGHSSFKEIFWKFLSEYFGYQVHKESEYYFGRKYYKPYR